MCQVQVIMRPLVKATRGQKLYNPELMLYTIDRMTIWDPCCCMTILELAQQTASHKTLSKQTPQQHT